jgi:hypothetical protein
MPLYSNKKVCLVPLGIRAHLSPADQCDGYVVFGWYQLRYWRDDRYAVGLYAHNKKARKGTVLLLPICRK